MAEVGVAVALLVLVTALGWLSPLALLVVGVALGAAGVLASLGVGVAYHRRLLTAAARCGALHARWWWAPSKLHPQLDEAGRSSVLPVFRAGVAVVVVAFVGFLLVAVAAVKAWMASS